MILFLNKLDWLIISNKIQDYKIAKTCILKYLMIMWIFKIIKIIKIIPDNKYQIIIIIIFHKKQNKIIHLDKTITIITTII